VRDAMPAGPGGPVSVKVPVPRDTQGDGKQSASALGSVVFALVMNVVLFVLIPLALTNAIWVYAGGGAIESGAQAGAPWYSIAWGWISALMHPVRPTVGFNLAEGLIRMGIFISMIFAMSRMAEMRRVFQYHGAEHKVVFAYEAGEGLTIENARRQPRLHPR